MAAPRKRTWTTRKGEEKTAWAVDYTDQHGRRHRRQLSTKREAEAWELRTKIELRDGIHAPLADSVTVAEAAQLWMERGIAEGLERGTLDSYRTKIQHHINPLIGDVRLSQLTTPAVEMWRDELLRRGQIQRRYVREVLVALKGILKNAKRLGLVAHNAATPTRVIVKERHKEKLEISRGIPSKAEMQAIIAATPERWRTAIVTTAFTGLRTGELRGLTWDEVDLTHRRLRIRQRADRWGTLGSPKTAGSRREIPLMPIVFSALRDWRLAHGATGFVFCQTQLKAFRGEIIGSTTLARTFRHTQRQIGIVNAAGEAKYNFHALRHFFASICIEAGFQPKRLQALLGHSSIVMSYDLYGHLFDDDEGDQARFQAMERSVFGPVK